MLELISEIPDASLLLALEPEELASKMLFLLRRRTGGAGGFSGNRRNFNPGNLEREMWEPSYNFANQRRYPTEKRDDISLALSEAWAWLEAQGLIVPDSDENGRNGWKVLSRRARKMESETEFARFEVARLLSKELLHPKIADVVWGAFMRGQYDVAAFLAMKAVEVAVRSATGLGNDLIGVPLMRKAFHPEDGPLSDKTSEKGERQGRMELFAGAIGSYKNPHSHRDVNLDDPHEALEIIYLANHLLRIVDARARTRSGPTA